MKKCTDCLKKKNPECEKKTEKCGVIFKKVR